MKDDKLFKNIIIIVVMTLAIICLGVVAVMLQALFVPEVDNEKIFSIIGPAFNTVIGAFVGLLGGLSINKPTECKDRN